MVMLKRFFQLIRNPSVRRVVFLCHPNADPDAVCSSYVLAGIVRRLQRNLATSIVASDGVSLVSRRLMSNINLPADLIKADSDKQPDLLILVDTSTAQQLAGWAERIKASRLPLVIVDHHAPHPSMKPMAPLLLTDEKTASTCEIVFRIAQAARHKLTRKEALALFCGLIYETKHFRIATPMTFEVAAKLTAYGFSIKEAFSYLSVPPSRSERLARLKAAQRVQLVNAADWVIALTMVNSYQSSAARGLLALGADVAVAAGESKGAVRVNLRCTDEFQSKTRIHLGKDLAFELGETFSGVGGGHASNAGVRGVGDASEVLARAKSMILKIIAGSKQMKQSPTNAL
ncbi:MAG: bifunctional oligoribonuclease/PAP phosphatase NrnA [Candidatus Bathyarchaeia archaeon]